MARQHQASSQDVEKLPTLTGLADISTFLIEKRIKDVVQSSIEK